LRQLGGLGAKVEKLIKSTTEYELNLARVKDSESKARHALKVAHDILNPVMLLKNELKASGSPLVKDAILNIESIAYDLLPEKAPVNMSAVESGDLLASLLSQGRIFSNNLHVLPESRIELKLLTSKSHFLRIALNLLKNACEATPKDEMIQLGFFEQNDMAELRILDQGPGFDGVVMGSTKASGSGLGLESTRALLTQLGGALEFYPQPTKGTLTIVKLPLYFAEPVTFSKVLLIEDDKYVRSRWKTSASEKGIQLEVRATLPDALPEKGSQIYLDRFLGEVDTSDWARQAIEHGLVVHSISAIDSASKIPPWLN
jgi:hypothetical protein